MATRQNAFANPLARTLIIPVEHAFLVLDYWYLLPASILIATVAMASGVEGATFFAPLFIPVLGLPPDVAIGAGLITEVFCFSSGLLTYARSRLIDYRLALALLIVTVPLAVAGSWIAG